MRETQPSAKGRLRAADVCDVDSTRGGACEETHAGFVRVVGLKRGEAAGCRRLRGRTVRDAACEGTQHAGLRRRKLRPAALSRAFTHGSKPAERTHDAEASARRTSVRFPLLPLHGVRPSARAEARIFGSRPAARRQPRHRTLPTGCSRHAASNLPLPRREIEPQDVRQAPLPRAEGRKNPI